MDWIFSYFYIFNFWVEYSAVSSISFTPFSLFAHRYRQRHTKHSIHHTTTPTSTTSIHIPNQTSWALNFVSQFNFMPSKESVVPTVNSSFLSEIQSTSTTKSSASSSSSSTSLQWICVVCGISWLNISVFYTCKESGGSCFDPDVENRRRQKKLGLLHVAHSRASKKLWCEIKGRWKYFGKKIVPNSFHSAAWHYWFMWKIFCAAIAFKPRAIHIWKRPCLLYCEKVQ